MQFETAPTFVKEAAVDYFRDDEPTDDVYISEVKRQTIQLDWTSRDTDGTATPADTQVTKPQAESWAEENDY